MELSHKLGKDNLVRDTLSRRKEFVEEKLHDSMTLKTIMYHDDSLLIRGIKKDYEQDKDALEIEEAFVQTKTTREQRRRMGVSSIRNGLIWFKQSKLYVPKGKWKKKLMY